MDYHARTKQEVKPLANSSWHSRTKEEIIRELQTSNAGLSQKEAGSRLQKYGQNIIKKTHKLRPIKILLEQFKSFLIYILIIAIIVSFLIGNLIDGFVILVIVVINSSLGFFQQYRAEKAIIGLRKLLVPISKVIRDNRYVEIPSTEIVPGDVLVFNAGDKINADCRIIESENLQTNEAVLTGESLPINKSDKKLIAETILPERFNMLYTGTEIVKGNAKAVVIATAMETEFGKIASQLQEIGVQKTPMQKRLDFFSKQLGLIILGLVLIIMFLGVFNHFDKFEMFMTSVALAVSSIPEGLPALLVISFAISTMAMSKKNVIIRKLPAVESLGSVTVICSDKTGTITEEEMNVQDIYVNGKNYIKKAKSIYLDSKKVDINKNKELSQIIKTSLLCNNARYEALESGEYSIIGDPTEKALLKLSLDMKISKKRLTELEPRLEEVEFDPERKMMSILREGERNNILYSKGAPEKIILKCTSELINGQIKSLGEARKKELLRESAKMEGEALRVLGFAYKNFSKESKAEEKGLIFLGFMGMIDPPRPEVKDAVWQAQNAGIRIKMITGDSVLTASAIAKQIGIIGEVITGKEIDEMSERDLAKQIDKIAIFARTTPQQKLKITKVLQERGETVAITGDGINDVLALKSADIGIAMGKRGTDVARDTADIILTDDNFASIIYGVREGRKTYDNIKKFTKYIFAVNFSEIILIAATLIMRMPLPLIPLQILWMNLITDSFPALTLSLEKEENVMVSKPRQGKSLLGGIWPYIVFGGLINFLACFIVYLIGINNGITIEATRSMVLTTGILFEVFFVYTCRSRKPLTEIGIFSNRWLNFAIILSIILQIVLLYTPLSIVFGLTSLSISQWLLVLPFAISGLVLFEITKYIKHRKLS